MFVGNSPNQSDSQFENVTGVRIYDESIQIIDTHFASFDETDAAFSIQTGVTSSTNHLVSGITLQDDIPAESFFRNFGIRGEGNSQINATSDAVHDVDGTLFGQPAVITLVIDDTRRVASARSLDLLVENFNRAPGSQKDPTGQVWINPIDVPIGNTSFQSQDHGVSLTVTKVVDGVTDGALGGVKDQTSLISYADRSILYHLESEEWGHDFELAAHGFKRGETVQYLFKDAPSTIEFDHANKVASPSGLLDPQVNSWTWVDGDDDGISNDIMMALVARRTDLFSI